LLIFLAVAAPYIYDRYLAFSGILANRPGKLERINAFKSHEIRFTDQIRNCEDVILEEALGIAFVSCDPGRDRWNTVMVSYISYYRRKFGTQVDDGVSRVLSTLHIQPNPVKTQALSGSTTTSIPHL
jgi:hypothetical protein